MNRLPRTRHSVFSMHAHLVFVVKYRRSVFDKVAIDTLRAIFAVASNNINAQLI